MTFPEARAVRPAAAAENAARRRRSSASSTQTQPNPDVDGLDTLYRAFWTTPDASEVIVAVGGGSALDTAKALMVGTESGEFDALVALLATGKPFRPHRVKSLIAVPTTSGTGSEVTALGHGLASRRRQEVLAAPARDVAGSRRRRPRAQLSLPAGPTLAAGLDALSHALESIWNVNANPVSDTPCRRRPPGGARHAARADEGSRQHRAARPHGAGGAAAGPGLLEHANGPRALDLLRHDDAPRPAARHRLLVHARHGARARAIGADPGATRCWPACSTRRWRRRRPYLERVPRSASASARASQSYGVAADRIGAHDRRRARRRARQELHRRRQRRHESTREPSHECRELRREAMRIGGERVRGDRVIEVLNPYTERLVGTVPKASIEDVRRAFAIARKPSSRSSRATSATRSATRPRRSSAAAPRRSPISSPPSAASARRIRSTRSDAPATCFVFGGNAALQDDGQMFSCDLTPHGKKRKVYTLRDPLLGVISRDHAVQPSAEPGGAQDRAVDRHQQPHGAEAHREDAAVGARCWPTSSTRPGLPPRDAVGRHRRSRARSPTRCSPTPTSTWSPSPAACAIGKYIAAQGRLQARRCSNSAATTRSS